MSQASQAGMVWWGECAGGQGQILSADRPVVIRGVVHQKGIKL